MRCAISLKYGVLTSDPTEYCNAATYGESFVVIFQAMLTGAMSMIGSTHRIRASHHMQ